MPNLAFGLLILWPCRNLLETRNALWLFILNTVHFKTKIQGRGVDLLRKGWKYSLLVESPTIKEEMLEILQKLVDQTQLSTFAPSHAAGSTSLAHKGNDLCAFNGRKAKLIDCIVDSTTTNQMTSDEALFNHHEKGMLTENITIWAQSPQA